MILEGLVTTLDPDGTPHVSPMGPRVAADMRQLVLRPFRTSHTYENLARLGEGVFHVTDDVELLAQAAVGQPQPLPRMLPASAVQGCILADTCRWYAFRIVERDERGERVNLVAEVVDQGTLREFFGLNRAKHAVVEAAILATRTMLLTQADVEAQLAALRPLVEKTGGPAEERAFALLERHVRAAYAGNVDQSRNP